MFDDKDALVYGKKRTLPALPMKPVDRCQTPAHGFQVDGILSTMDVSFLSDWLSRYAVLGLPQ
jgi:hypothetical protein